MNEIFLNLSGSGVCSQSCDELRKVNVSRPISSKSEGCLVRVSLNSTHRDQERIVTSERDLRFLSVQAPRPALSTPAMNTLTPTPTTMRPSVVKQKASTLPLAATSVVSPPRKNKGLSGFFRRLSPHLRRAWSPPPRPWITVEPRTERTSVASDHSFEAALKNQNSRPTVVDPLTNPEADGRYQQNGHTCNSRSTFSVASLFASLRPSRDKHKKKEKNQKIPNGTKKSGHKSSNSNNKKSPGPEEAHRNWRKSKENGFPGSLKSSPADLVSKNSYITKEIRMIQNVNYMYTV